MTPSRNVERTLGIGIGQRVTKRVAFDARITARPVHRWEGASTPRRRQIPLVVFLGFFIKVKARPVQKGKTAIEQALQIRVGSLVRTTINAFLVLFALQ